MHICLEIVLISELIEGWLVIHGLLVARGPSEDSICLPGDGKRFLGVLTIMNCLKIS